MPATKTRIFTKFEKELALIGRALAHPARIRILNLLEESAYVRNCDLSTSLQLHKTTVHDHVKKLEEARLIQRVFFNNSFYILKVEGADLKMKEYIENRNQTP